MNNAITLLAAREMGSQQKTKMGPRSEGSEENQGKWGSEMLGVARTIGRKPGQPGTIRNISSRCFLQNKGNSGPPQQRSRVEERKIGKWTTGRDTQGVWCPHHSEWICCLKSVTAGGLTSGSVINVTSWALFSQRCSTFTAHLWTGMWSQARFKEVCKN